VETRPVTINGSMVITKVVTHTELQGSPPAEVTVQDCYFVQDLANNVLGSGVKIISSDRKLSGGSPTVVEGAKVTSIKGIMTEAGGCRAVVNPTVTIEGSATVRGMAMVQKSLMGPCVDQSLGSYMDTTGMLVRVFGRVPAAAGFDVTYGAFIVYVDDGSGAVDGRESSSSGPLPGIRCLINASDPNPVVPDLGDYVMLEGIAGYETLSTGSYHNVRKILYPTLTILGSGT